MAADLAGPVLLVGSCKAGTDSPLTPWQESCLAQLLLLHVPFGPTTPFSTWDTRSRGYPRACPCQGLSKGPYPAQSSGLHFLDPKGVPPTCSTPLFLTSTCTLAVVFSEGTVSSSPLSLLGIKQQPLLPQQPLSPSLAFQILQERMQQPCPDPPSLPGMEAVT